MTKALDPQEIVRCAARSREAEDFEVWLDSALKQKTL